MNTEYVIHKDHVTDGWNVFKKNGDKEEYVISFSSLTNAQDYCDDKNSELQDALSYLRGQGIEVGL